jgi:hypothetical protein
MDPPVQRTPPKRKGSSITSKSEGGTSKRVRFAIPTSYIPFVTEAATLPNHTFPSTGAHESLSDTVMIHILHFQFGNSGSK